LSCERGPECGIGTRAQATCITLQPAQRCLRAREWEYLLLPKSFLRLDTRSKKPDISPDRLAEVRKPNAPRKKTGPLRRYLGPRPSLATEEYPFTRNCGRSPGGCIRPYSSMHIGALTNRPAALGVETECCVGLGDALTSVLFPAPQSLFRTRASGQPRPTLPNYPAGRCWRLGAL
jgi:hypothetical protein